MLVIVLVLMFFGHCLVINSEMICRYGETVVFETATCETWQNNVFISLGYAIFTFI